MKKIYVFLILFSLFVSCFSFVVVAPDTSIVSDSLLIDSLQDYKDLGFDISKIDDLVLYEKECLVEGHMPLVFKFNNNDNVAVSEKNSFLSSSSVSSKGFSDISYVYRILRDYVYTYEVPVYDTKKVCYDVFDNRTGRNVTKCVNESFVSSYKKVSEVRYHWVDIKSLDSLVISKQGFVVVDIVGRWKANTVGKSVDIIPSVTINGITSSFPKYAWWNSSWNYKKSITFNHSQVPSTLTNFPVLVNLSSDTGLASYAQDDGDDICFVNSSESVKFNHEIELFNGTTGRLVCWVNVTSLSSVVDTVIYMYYGNSGCSNQQNKVNTWDSNYLAVFHMNDASGGAIDSKHLHNATESGGAPDYSATGKIGKAIDFELSNSDSLLISNSGDLEGMSAITVECWLKSETLELMAIAAKMLGLTYAGETWYFRHTNAGKIAFCMAKDSPNQETSVTSSGSISTGVWGMATASWANGEKLNVYVNGGGLTQSSVTFSGMSSPHGEARISRFGSLSSNYFDGIIDELRISNTKRSSDWIKTEYNSMVNSTSGGFFILGIEQTKPGCSFTLGTPSPANGSMNIPLTGSWCISINSSCSSFNYSIEFNHSGGSSSFDGATNGTKCYAYSLLYCGLNYTVWVNVTSGVSYVNKTFWFRTIDCVYCPDIGVNYTNYTIWKCFNLTSENGSFNFTFEVVGINFSQNINGTWVSNGTYCIELVNLSLNTIYYMWVNVSDGSCWDNYTTTINLSFGGSCSSSVLFVGRDRILIGLSIGFVFAMLTVFVFSYRKRKR